MSKIKAVNSISGSKNTQFHDLVERVGDWLWEVDKNSVYTYSSPKILDILGYTAEEIIGKTPFDLMPDEEAERVVEIVSSFTQQQRSFNNLENIKRHKDGHLITFETSGIPFFDQDGAFCGYRGINRDISRHKQTEAAHTLNQQRLLEAQHIAQMGHWEWNIQEQTIYWSDEVYYIFGLDPQHYTPTFKTFIDFIHPDDQIMIRQTIHEALTKNNYNIDHRILLPDGSIRVLHAEGKVEYDETGQAIKIFGTTQDITERKYLEEALNTIANIHLATDLTKHFQTCIASLAQVYNTHYAFIGLFPEDSQQHIMTQAIWANGEFIDNFEYPLEGTPCADIINREKTLIPKNAATLYPEDNMLADMKVESYFGAPLRSASGETLGLISVFDTRPMEITSYIKPLLGIFAQHIASYLDHNRTEEKIKVSEKELRNIFSNMQDTYFRTDTEGNITRVSESIEPLLGYFPDEIINTKIQQLYSNPDKRTELVKLLQDKNGTVKNIDLPLKHKDDSVVWVSCNAQYIKDANSNIIGIESMMRDINQSRNDKLQMQKMSRALEQSADMVMITDNKGIVEYINPAFENITGYHYSEIVGGPSSVVKSDKQNSEFYHNLWKTIATGQVFRDTLVNKKKNGEFYYEEKTITPIKNVNGEITHFISTGRDISQRIEHENRLNFMAHHDALTKLPNRTLFMDRLQLSLAHARRYSKMLAVLFIDLDRFKNINDTLGHNIGDKMLTQLAERLQNNIREGDSIARLGGDEFAVLLNDIDSGQDVSFLASKILASMEKPLEVDGRELFITASIGISLFPNDATEAESLLKYADMAMYKAKDSGKNNYQFYSTDMSAKAFQHLTMENSLRYALEREEFILYYQPQINVQTNEITAVEALIRWQHPDMGLIPPDDFIPLLEETGLINQVGYWVITTACQQLQNWHDAGFSDLRMSVNVSGRQFHAHDFIEKIEAFVNKNKISPNMLEMEITESVLMENQQSTIIALETLSKLGFKIAIDDFGTGYSSLSYLRRFMVDTLKIDKSFIYDVVENPDDAAITSAIISMAQSLRLKVIAEGVETQQQLDFIKQHHCKYVQGYLFSRPLPKDKLTQFLHTQQNLNNKN